MGRSGDGKSLEIGVQVDGVAAQVSVTYVVVVWNDKMIKGTAQFVSLSVVVTSGESTTSPLTLTIDQFNSSYTSCSLLGQP